MPNNTINLSIDILKVQGAKKITGKDGKEYVAICIPDSRLKPFTRKDGSECLFFSLDVKSNKDGEDAYQKTHFVAEATTKEEREKKERLPIIGNGREFVFGGSSSTPKAKPKPDPTYSEPESDDIPFN